MDYLYHKYEGKNLLLSSMDMARIHKGSLVRFQMVSLEFFIDTILRSHYGPGVDSASNRN
jgi:hypothetical protein